MAFKRVIIRRVGPLSWLLGRMDSEQIPPWAAALSAIMFFAVAIFLWFIAAEDCVDTGSGKISLFGLTCYVPAGSTYIPLGQRLSFVTTSVLLVLTSLSPALVCAILASRKQPRYK
jgi:hypothetical protein